MLDLTRYALRVNAFTGPLKGLTAEEVSSIVDGLAWANRGTVTGFGRRATWRWR